MMRSAVGEEHAPALSSEQQDVGNQPNFDGKGKDAFDY